jgi:hypothetical protein
MSEAFDRGRAFEIKVQKITRQKLHMDIRRDKQSGAGIHKQDIRDRYNELPIFIECKDHQTIKPKEWWREADAKSNYGQAPVVVFPDNEEVLCVMRYTDLLQLVKEVADWKETAEDLRQPIEPMPKTAILKGFGAADGTEVRLDSRGTQHSKNIGTDELGRVIAKKTERGAKQCRNGHLSDEWGYCQQLDCKYSRGYRPPKVKKR